MPKWISIPCMYPLGQNDRYLIRYGVESWLDAVGEGAMTLVQIEGVVVKSFSDDGDGEVCGRLRAYIIKANDLLARGEFKRGLWREAEELDDVAGTVYAEDGEWADCVAALWPAIKSKDVFVIEEIFLDDAHRGMGLGLSIAEQVISIFGDGCGLAVISPWPTEVVDRDDEDEARRAHLKIGRHYERIGFKMMPGTDMWARSFEHDLPANAN